MNASEKKGGSSSKRESKDSRKKGRNVNRKDLPLKEQMKSTNSNKATKLWYLKRRDKNTHLRTKSHHRKRPKDNRQQLQLQPQPQLTQPRSTNLREQEEAQSCNTKEKHPTNNQSTKSRANLKNRSSKKRNNNENKRVLYRNKKSITLKLNTPFRLIMSKIKRKRNIMTLTKKIPMIY